MKITDVSIKNFLTIGDEVRLNLDNKGMILITGDNRDDSSAISNGAGKSTIGDAICWSLYGVTARGETGDAIVNNIINKDCCVEVLIEDEGSIYSIARYRKDKKHKNSLQVENVLTSSVLTKGTDKLTQELVNRIIGCSVEVFKSAIYAGQDSIPNLPGMTDKNLKEIVEEAAGINRLGEAHVIAREDFKLRDTSLTTAVKDLEVIEKSMVDLKDGLVDLVNRQKGFAKDITDEIQKLRENQFDLLVRRTTLLANKPLVDEVGLLSEIKILDEKLVDYLKERKLAEDRERDCANQLRRTDSVFKADVGLVKTNLAELESIEDRIGKPCGECGKSYCEEDLESASEIAKLKLNKSKHTALTSKAVLGVDRVTHSEALEALNLFIDTVQAVNENKVATAQIRSELTRFDNYTKELIDIDEYVTFIDAQVVQKQMSSSPYLDMIETGKTRYKVLKIKRDTLVEIRDNAVIARDLAGDAVKIFSPAGVRAHVIDTVTPYLNERTSHYLATLSDGNISAVWNTLSKTKTGELREKFIIEVSNDKGANNFGGLSGGEKRKVRIATSLALQDLVASRASKPLSLFIGDELDDALDMAGLERLMMLLEEKAREKGTVLIISHNEISDWCREQAVIIKENGFSRIEGALVYE